MKFNVTVGFLFFFFFKRFINKIEIIVGQESQILPAFIIKLDIESCLKELDKWTRTVVEPENEHSRMDTTQYCIDMTQKEDTYDDYKLLI